MVTLTDSRLLSRSEMCTTRTFFCHCCCDHPHIDSSINLRDIAQLREYKFRGYECIEWILRILNCACCCPPEPLVLAGSFGSHYIYFDKSNIFEAQDDIPSTILSHSIQNRP